MSYQELSQLLEDYLDPKPSIWVQQHKFISRMQYPNETVTMFASELKKLTSNCNFNCPNCKHSIADMYLCLQFIRGLKDDDIRTKMLQEKENSFSELLKTATTIEMSKTENINITNTRMISRRDPIHKLSTSYSFKNQQRNTRVMLSVKSIKDLKGKCFRCGKDDHRADKCGSINDTCHKCKRKGHLARVCLRSLYKQDTNQLENSITSDESTCDINTIRSEIPEKYIITVEIENKKVSMEFDTGAALSSMSLTKFKQLGIDKKIFNTEVKMRTYTGEIIKPVGVVYVKCSYRNQIFYNKLYLIKKEVDAIFGRSWMKDLKLELADIRCIHAETNPKLDELLEQYSTNVFSNNLGKIPNYQGHLNLRPNTQPIFIKPRRVPYALKSKVDEEIERLCTQGVITKIDHSEWGTPIVPVVKPNGSIRLCADYKVALNKVIEDEQYPIPIIEDIFSEMNGGELFCTLDISQAYICTHKGTFKVNRLMFGVKVTPNLWQKFMDRTLQGIDGVKCFFDDIIIQGSCEKELLQRLKEVLDRLKENSLRVNKDKCHFFQKSIKYLGHTIDKHGLHKCQEKVNAIANTERPTNVNELRTFLGMANFYNKFIPNLASITSPMNELLKSGVNFNWTMKCEKSFQKIKKPLVIATDASPTGLGAVLSHRLQDGSERPIAFASRTLSKSEKNYSQIDKEATAIYWGLKKFFHYCYGRKFILVTDHKTLTAIFHPHKTLPTMSTMRLFHYAHFLSGFDYTIEYRSSENNSNADYLSRFPVEKTRENKIDRNTIFQTHLINTLNIRPELIRQETQKDTELQSLLQSLQSGRSLREFGYKDNEFTIQDDCLFRASRIVIPKSLQSTALEELHLAHIGIVKMKLLARSFIYWKNIDRDIENMVHSCRTCRLQQNEPAKVPIHHWESPAEPWQRIHIDFAGPVAGYQLLIVVDAYSKWVEVFPTKTTTSQWCINKLEDVFATFEIPQILISDNGRQFTSAEFETFLKNAGVIHRTSAPYHPATNGQAERFVQTIKKSLRRMEESRGSIHEKLRTILTHMRRTPNSTGDTPYQLMFNREVRTKLHVMFRERQNSTYNSTNIPVTKAFLPGEKVQVRAYRNAHIKWEFGEVIKRLGKLHYEVRTEEGGVVRRHVNQMLPARGVSTTMRSPPANTEIGAED
ncbi:hypothetical protein ABMA27_003149 [Loxostege sticticalis]|uniref:RNA-directed DNA polymerase n=1 Tax=Loxostege sticticalis TaxID=481309 RepID=A0ABR3HS41_LOXSC